MSHPADNEEPAVRVRWAIAAVAEQLGCNAEAALRQMRILGVATDQTDEQVADKVLDGELRFGD